jgi:hypothetical protein
MKDVLGVLEHLGYREIRLEDTGERAPLFKVNGRYGTTDETRIISRKERPTCWLVDVQTGGMWRWPESPVPSVPAGRNLESNENQRFPTS